MDINMPELSGIELSREIFRVNPSIRIIFLTAYEEYVLDAMESNIIDYILKPITVKRMQRTMDKLERVLSEERKRRAAAVRGEEGGDIRWFNAFRDNQYHRIDWKDGCYITVEGRRSRCTRRTEGTCSGTRLATGKPCCRKTGGSGAIELFL